MSAPTLTEVTEEAVIASGKAALAAVRSDTFPAPSCGGRRIQDYADWLAEDLKVYARLLKDPADPDYAHPADMYPELARWWPHDALGQAVAKAVEDIGYGTGALIGRVRRFCGDQVADSVLAAAAEAGHREGEK